MIEPAIIPRLALDSAHALAAGQARQLLTTARVRTVNRVSGIIPTMGDIRLALQKRA